MAQITTLEDFITQTQREFKHSKGDLSALLNSIQLAAKLISREVNKAGLADEILGAAGAENVQGEAQQKLDVYADELFIKTLRMHGVVCGIASEENDDYMAFDDCKDGKYIVLFDPLDGSSNIDVNVSIGTIFSIYHRVSEVGQPVTMEDFLQPGDKQIAAGYVLYGSSTMLIYSTGHGVNGFTLDASIGEFCLSHPNIKTPDSGKIYSLNEGNWNIMDQSVRDFVNWCREGEKPFSARYIGSLVADFHRNLLKGGVYIYPATTSAPNGKLRLLYENNPMAFIAEQAGGLALNGSQRIMEIKPTELHQRTPLFIGSKELVEKAVG